MARGLSMPDICGQQAVNLLRGRWQASSPSSDDERQRVVRRPQRERRDRVFGLRSPATAPLHDGLDDFHRVRRFTTSEISFHKLTAAAPRLLPRCRPHLRAVGPSRFLQRVPDLGANRKREATPTPPSDDPSPTEPAVPAAPVLALPRAVPDVRCRRVLRGTVTPTCGCRD